MPPFDVITTGRIGVDLYPVESQRTLQEAEKFAKSLGGSPCNVAVAAARLGCRTAVATRVGDDPFGAYLRAELVRYGVDDRWVTVAPGTRTPLAFCEIFPPDNFPLLFYRGADAPDLQLTAEHLDLDAIAACRVFWTTGGALSAEPSRGTVLAALKTRAAAAHGGETIHDLDFRPSMWASAEDAGKWAREAVRSATIAIGNREEVGLVAGTVDPQAGARALLELGVRLAVVKCGHEGVFAMHADGAVYQLPSIEVEVVNGLGAGDAFGGALSAGLVRGWPLQRTLEIANAAGAIVASRFACAPAMPNLAEIQHLAGAL